MQSLWALRYAATKLVKYVYEDRMRKTGINMGAVKKSNRSQILRLINQTGPISKKDIAESLGLTPAAVTLICSDLIESGLLIESGIGENEAGKAGRKKILIDINPNFGYVYGINIDSRSTTISICNIVGSCIVSMAMPTDRDMIPEEFIKLIAKQCIDLLQLGNISRDNILGAGVGVPGRVNTDTGISEMAYGVWDRPVNVGSILREELDTTIMVENNVNAFAVAENIFGYGKETSNLLLIKWGPGVGSSIIICNEIYKPADRRNIELGHYIVDPNGSKCSCGRSGCLETVISEKALENKTEEELDEAINLFARTIVNAITVTGPDCVVLYGGMIKQKEVKDKLIQACKKIDASCNENYILASNLIEIEDYVGPVAHCVSNLIL